MDRDRSSQVHSIEERLMKCIEEKRYSDALVIGNDLLPLIADEDRSVRLRIYHLLKRCPEVELSEAHRWNAREVAEEVMADSARAPEERIRAHMLRFLIGSFPFGTPPPDGARVAANRRWLPRELMELYAEEAATELLGRGSEGDPEIRRDAHIVRCFTCPDHRSVEVHMEALLVDGDENAIVQGCCGASEEFHQETACRFLNRALAAVTKEKEIARLLEYKLSVLLGLYMRESVEGEDQEEQRDAVYRDFVATMAHLELCGGAPFERAHGHVYFAIFAEWHSECALAELHCDMAQVLAEHLQNPRFQQDVAHCREWILSEENDEAQGMDEDDEDSKDYDEDADDDDDGEEWKRA